MEKIDFDAIKNDLCKIGQAIAKAVGPDIRLYRATHELETYNNIRILRGDYINTNLKAMVDGMELHTFKRSSWDGRLLIDRRNNLTYSICTKQTLESIPKAKNRHIPHYLQTILHIENAYVKPMYEQMMLPGMQAEIMSFDEEEYRDDYMQVMGEDITFDDKYHHLVITYETKQGEITYISAKLLDPNCELSQEYSMMDLLKPDYIDLSVDVAEKPAAKDARNLVGVKRSLVEKKEKVQTQEPLVSAKREEGAQQE